jgi:hypothetical protein
MKYHFTRGAFGDTVVELSYLDVFKMLFGREVSVSGVSTVIRVQRAYEAFNLKAGADRKAARPAPEPVDRKTES